MTRDIHMLYVYTLYKTVNIYIYIYIHTYIHTYTQYIYTVHIHIHYHMHISRSVLCYTCCIYWIVVVKYRNSPRKRLLHVHILLNKVAWQLILMCSSTRVNLGHTRILYILCGGGAY